MVVVTVTGPDRTPRRMRFDRTFTIGTELENVTISVEDPDVRIGLPSHASFLTLNGQDVDHDFVHVIHVGDKLEFPDHEILFELVAGTPVEVARVLGEVSTVPDAAELEVLEALRADPADAVAREVYADWLDSHERCNEAELVRLQWLPDGKRVTDPEAFSSEWMSHQPRAIQLRLRDLAQLTDPLRRALSSRPTMMCRVPSCARRWEALQMSEPDTVRYCNACDRTVEFCSTFDALAARGDLNLPAAIDPILVYQVAHRAYENWDEPTNPVVADIDE